MADVFEHREKLNAPRERGQAAAYRRRCYRVPLASSSEAAAGTAAAVWAMSGLEPGCSGRRDHELEDGQ
jgi:hypothetical protein